MISYRCTHYDVVEGQCWRVASRQVNKRWVCLKHLDCDTPPPPPLPIKESLGSTSPDPEVRKRYHREYRRNYRITKPHVGRTYGYSWPARIDLQYSGTLWRLGNESPTFSTCSYHCERCGNAIEVTRKVDYYVGMRRSYRLSYQSGFIQYRNKQYRVFAQHKCTAHPSSALKMVHCDRCGIWGVDKHTIKSNRIYSGLYGDNLCIECYRIMYKFWRLYEEQSQLVEALGSLRREMRKLGMTPNQQTVSRNWWITKAFDYDKDWWCNTGIVTRKAK